MEIIHDDHIIGYDKQWYTEGSIYQALKDAGYTGFTVAAAINSLLSHKAVNEKAAKIIVVVEKYNDGKFRIISRNPKEPSEYGMIADNISTEEEAKKLARISLVLRQYHPVETLTEKDITPDVIAKALKEWTAYQSDQKSKAEAHQKFHTLEIQGSNNPLN